MHAAVVAGGMRRSDQVREMILASKAKKDGARLSDLAQLLPSASRDSLLADPFTQESLELILDWQYGIVDELALPSWSATEQQAAQDAAAAKGEAAAGGTGSDLADAGSEVLNYFSTALFGTPSKAPATPSSRVSVAAPGSNYVAGANGSTKHATAAVKAQQVPLLWQLADSLEVTGLKAVLLPLFESSPLPANFAMATVGFERLKMCVRALELSATEVVAVLSEQLRLPSDPALLTDGITELAIAASACDVSRYDALAACGLLPTDDTALAEVLDRSTLRVASEAQVYDLIRHHFAATDASATTQEMLWATCRFTYLPADRLVTLSELPNVPPRWLALACAQRAAALGGAKTPPPSGLSASEQARLKPRSFYH